jgi:hypothetical protein
MPTGWIRSMQYVSSMRAFDITGRLLRSIGSATDATGSATDVTFVGTAPQAVVPREQVFGG